MQQNPRAELEEQVHLCTAQLQAALARVEQQNRQIETIKQLVQLLQSDVVVNELLQTTVDLMPETSQVSCCLLLRPDSARKKLCYINQSTTEPEELTATCLNLFHRYEASLAQGEAVVRAGVRKQGGQGTQGGEVFTNKSQENFSPASPAPHLLQSYLIVPIRWQQDLWGGLTLYSREPEQGWTEDEIAFVQMIANYCAVALRQSQLTQQVQQVEDLLLNREQQFQAVFEETFQFTAILTTEGILQAVDQTALNFGGFGRADVVNRPFWETYWWTIQAETQEQLKNAIARTAAGEFVRYQVDVFGKKNTAITIDFSIKPVRNETGQVVMLISEGRDITQFKQAAQQELNERTTEILESMTDAFVAVDLDWNLTYINPQAELLMFKGKRHNLLGKSVWKVYRAAVNTRFYQELHRAAAERVTVHFEELYPPCDRWFEVHAYPAKDGLSIYYRDITERKQAEAELYRREQSFRALAENSPDAIIRFNRQLRCLYVNPATERITGLQAQTFISKINLGLGFPPELVSLWRQKMHHVFETGQNEVLELEYLTPEGLRYFQMLIVPELSQEGAVELVLNIARDITELKTREQELQQLHVQLEQKTKLLDTVVDTTPDGLYLFDRAKRFTYINRTGLERLARKKADVLGKTGEELGFPPEIMTPHNARMESVFASAQTLTGETSFLNPETGLQSYASYIFTPIFNADSCVEALLITYRDITDRKQAEAALKESEAKLSTILNSAIAVIINFRVFADGDWEYDYFSSGAEVLYGYTLEELMADKNLWSSRVVPEDREAVIVPLEQDIFAEQTTQLEYRFLHKDGTVRWFSMTVFSQRDEAADCWVVTTVDTDISDRKQVEEQLKASLQEKEALLKEVHHRVKNNLQVITSLLDFQAQKLREPQALEAFRVTQNRVKSIALIHQKLYQSDNLAKVNLADYIYNLTTHLIQSYTLNPDNITLQLKLDEVFSSLDTAIPCGLVINELVSNALKHGFPRNSQGTIWVELNSVGEVTPEQSTYQLRLVVGNDGIKLPELPNLHQAKSVGFQLIHALVQQLNGNIEIDRSRGTEFRISLFDSVFN